MVFLSYVERALFEELFVNCGSVLDFTHRTFRDFIIECIELDVESCEFQEKLPYSGASNGKIFVTILETESEHNIRKVLNELMYYYEEVYKGENAELFEKCENILSGVNFSKDNIKLLKIDDFEEEFKLIIDEINKSIENEMFISTLDRLHTLLVKLLKLYCKKHNISIKEDARLDEIYKKYISNIQITSKMSKTISKSMMRYLSLDFQSILEQFNNVRNNHSFAHDNEDLVSKIESKFILNSILCLIEFIQDIEKQNDR